jgi:hypothetical protein
MNTSSSFSSSPQRSSAKKYFKNLFFHIRNGNKEYCYFFFQKPHRQTFRIIYLDKDEFQRYLKFRDQIINPEMLEEMKQEGFVPKW